MLPSQYVCSCLQTVKLTQSPQGKGKKGQLADMIRLLSDLLSVRELKKKKKRRDKCKTR